MEGLLSPSLRAQQTESLHKLPSAPITFWLSPLLLTTAVVCDLWVMIYDSCLHDFILQSLISTNHFTWQIRLFYNILNLLPSKAENIQEIQRLFLLFSIGKKYCFLRGMLEFLFEFSCQHVTWTKFCFILCVDFPSDFVLIMHAVVRFKFCPPVTVVSYPASCNQKKINFTEIIYT